MNNPFLLGLTGSIGMGKSTTAKMFAEAGLEVWDADAAVHRMYGNGGAAVEPIREIYPSAIIDGAVSRDVLKSWIAQDPTALKKIEKIVHPLVAKDRLGFVQNAKSDIVVLDIPLLYETGGDTHVDAVAVVSAPAKMQRERVLARPGMTVEQFESILAKQTPDEEKRQRADFIIPSETIEGARAKVGQIVADIRKSLNA